MSEQPPLPTNYADLPANQRALQYPAELGVRNQLEWIGDEHDAGYDAAQSDLVSYLESRPVEVNDHGQLYSHTEKRTVNPTDAEKHTRASGEHIDTILSNVREGVEAASLKDKAGLDVGRILARHLVTSPLERKPERLTLANQYDLTRLGSSEPSTIEDDLTPDHELNLVKLGEPIPPKPEEEPQPKMVWGYRGPRKRMDDAQLKQLWGSDFNKYKKTPKPVEKLEPEPITPSPVHPVSRTPLMVDEIPLHYPDFTGEPAEAVTEAEVPLEVPELPEPLRSRKPEAKKVPETEPVFTKDRQALIDEYKRERSSKFEPNVEGVLASESDVTPEEVMESTSRIIPLLEKEDLQRMLIALREKYPEAAAKVATAISEYDGSAKPENVPQDERAKRLAKVGRKLGAIVMPFKSRKITERIESMPADEQLFDAA